MIMEKFLNPSHPIRCIITGLSDCGNSIFLRNLILLNFNEFDKIYINSPSLHKDFYPKLFKCFSNFIPINIIPNALIEKNIDVEIEDIVNNKALEKSYIEIETYESIEELKFKQEYDDGGTIILEQLSEEGMNDPLVQAMFKRSRHNNLSIFIISQDYFELPKGTNRANGNIYQNFKPNKFRDIQNLYQDNSSMDMTLIEFKYLICKCWDKTYQPLTNNMTKDKCTGRYQLGLNSIFVTESFLF